MGERKTTKFPTRKRGEKRSSLDPNQVAMRAYERFLRRGEIHGHDVEDWLKAEEELRGN